MAVSVNSGNVTANILTSSATYLTATPLYASRASAGTTTLGTCPANKRWRILSVALMCSVSGAAQIQSYLKANGVELLSCVCTGTGTAGGNNNNSVAWDIAACPIITATQTITLTTDATQYGQACVTYYEESV